MQLGCQLCGDRMALRSCDDSCMLTMVQNLCKTDRNQHSDNSTANWSTWSCCAAQCYSGSNREHWACDIRMASTLPQIALMQYAKDTDVDKQRSIPATVWAMRAKGSLFSLLSIWACPFSSMLSLAGACSHGSPSICMASVSNVVMVAEEHWHSLLALERPTCSWPRCQLPYTPTTCRCTCTGCGQNRRYPTKL